MSEGHRLNRIIQITFKATPPDTKEVSKKVEDVIKGVMGAKVALETLNKLATATLTVETVATGGTNLLFGGLTALTAAMNLTGGKV
jgi:hypothetical protein